jgi:cytochrome P450
MPLVTEMELPELDYLDDGLRGERFHERMAELRGEGWLATTPLGFVVLDHESVEFFLRTRSATFPGHKIGELFGIEDGPLHEELMHNILCIDGADHGRLRQLVNPALTARAADRYRPAMREFIAQLTDAVADAGACDFVAAIAKPYPSLMIATVMGAPLEDAERLHHWSYVIQRQFASNLFEERGLIEEAVVEFYDYVRALIARRREDPGEDLISRLIAAEQDGDRLSEVECVNLALNVLIGGVDTTQAQLAHGIRLFAEHPEQWELLAGSPELVKPAVEEVIRYEPITPFTARILVEEVSFRDVTFPVDTVILCCAFSGNRDGAADDGTASDGAADEDAAHDGAAATDPERFDIAAPRSGSRTLTFGAGIHYCLGANLARAELEEAFAHLAPRLRDLRLDGEPQYDTINGVYGLERLPIRFAPTSG